MSTKPLEIKGFVKEVKPDKIIIGFSETSPNINSQRNIAVRPEKIQFRNQQAPINLISPNTLLIIKELNKEILEVRLENNLDIHAFFGELIFANPASKTISVSYGLISYELSYKQLAYYDNKPLPQSEISTLVKSPVIIYFNGESVFEARILSVDWKKVFKLDYFRKNSRNEEETDFFVMKDERLLLYRINKKFVYYKGFDSLFNEEDVKKCIGVEVEVFLNSQNDVIASVKSTSSLKFGSSCVSENRSLQLKTSSEKFDGSSFSNNKSLQLEKEKSIDFIRQVDNQELIPVLGVRLYDSKSQQFYKENSYFGEVGVVVLALLETCYRFPKLNLRNILYNQYYEVLNLYQGETYQQVLYSVFSKCRNNIIGEMEHFYEDISKNSNFFEYYARHFIKNPHDFALISNTYQICIVILDSNNQRSTYLPFDTSAETPIVYFRINPSLNILYTAELMTYDGYSLTTLNYSLPAEIDPIHLFFYSPKTKDFKNLFESIFRLQDFVFSKDLSNEHLIQSTIKSISKSLNSLSAGIPSESLVTCADYYKKFLQFKFKEQNMIKCDCGKLGDQEFVCGDHNLCRECAFLSSRLRACVTCGSMFEKQVRYEGVSCSNCCYMYDEQYHTGFFCRCILCTGCVFNLLKSKSNRCFRGHLMKQVDSERSVEYLQQVGYQIDFNSYKPE